MPKQSPAIVLTDEALALIAGRFKALSEPLRLKLIIALEQGEKTVTELVNATSATQTNVSRHLQTLAKAGVVCRRKDGRSVIYCICDPNIFALCKHVCGSLQKHYEAQAKNAQSLII
jgi:DNA-binding transcriptional ArsR family regulator